ncbi:nucleoside kinase [Pseudoflavonifractor sp. 524-17]|uniref:uridine kinase family protein n=1 Tax=Pseudoflavonifractor sp. 524-17 TaxID=2304577 RepID=UPI00137B079F|nr:nucleoside kinase [Pseudoflavonifractor sp. 524-17]NCE63619.1 nucleoside kinase [Pseudoflavonifractor sp. 524-17]
MPYQLQDILQRTRQDPKGFLAECDAVYHQRVSAAADRIQERLAEGGSGIVLLSGPSGSGKTTTALKLEEELIRRGVGTHAISLDDYFKTPDRATAPRTPEGDIDYESPLLLDMVLLDETFTRLAQGEEVIIPKFEFARQMRNDARGRPLRLGKQEIAIFEGIHALNDDIAGRHPEATRLYISARSDILDGAQLRFKGTWTRITRRAVRDYNFRGTDMAATLEMWHNVRRGEKRFISPFKNRAHILLDSSLPYEAPVFAHYTAPLAGALSGVSERNPRWRELHDLVDAFGWFDPIDPALVPPGALIREFIGGGTYQYK